MRTVNILMCKFEEYARTQFDFGPFREFCTELGIEMCFAAVRHPQSNGIIERANNILLGLNRPLVGLAKGLWVEELPKVLWSLHTTVTRLTGFTPFHLLFGNEAMTPTEIKGRSLRVQQPETIGERELSLDLVEGTRLHAVWNLDCYIAKTKAWYNPKILRSHCEPSHPET